MRRVLKWLLGFVGAILLVWVITVLVGMGEEPKATVSAETTYFVQPLHADGTVNYVAALNARYGEGVTPANNAAVVLLAAIGPRLLDDGVRDKTAELMGVDLPPADGKYFQALDEYFQTLPPRRWPLSLSSGEKLTSEQVKSIRAELEKRMEVDGQIPPGFLDAQGLCRPSQLLARREELAIEAPWPARQYPILADWLGANSEPLDKLADIVGRSRYFIPLVSTEDPPSVLGTCGANRPVVRELAKALLLRAMLRLDSRAWRLAWSDIRLALQLADRLGRSPYLLDRVMGHHIWSRATTAAYVVADGGLPLDVARWMLAEVRELSPPGSLAEAIDGHDRCIKLDAVMCLIRVARGGRASGLGPLDEAAGTPIDWNRLLRRVNAYYDLSVTAWGDSRSEETLRARAALEDLHAPLVGTGDNIVPWPVKRVVMRGVPVIGRRVNTEAFTDFLLAATLISWESMYALADVAQTRLHLAELAFAVAAYEVQTGRLPDKLARLVPKYVKQLPLDPLTQQGYVYVRRGRSAILYSLGKNGKDDAGENKHSSRHDEPDDISVRFDPAKRR